MTAALGSLWRVVSLGWLIGPIFTKELRVGSRRRRSYLLRVIYLMLMLCFVALTYSATQRYSYDTTYSAARMAEIGKAVCATIVAVQFCALQLFAVIMCSTAISEERYRRTLGVLMTTPITSLQIVMGKLLSRTFQLFLLLSLSLPLLALVRIFGGVPWDFLVAGVCITATAMFFAACVSLFYSIFTRHAYAVILLTLLTGAILYLAIPGIVLMVLKSTFTHSHTPPWDIISVIIHANPFAMWMMITQDLFSPGMMAQTPFFFSWPVHCGSMLAASGLLLLWAVALVRKAALRQVAGDPGAIAGDFARSRRRANIARLADGATVCAAYDGTAVFQPAAGRAGSQPADPAEAIPAIPVLAGRVRRVGNWPVLWRELRLPLIRSWVIKLVLFGVVASLLLCIYFIDTDAWYSSGFHTAMCTIYLVAGLLATAVVSATVVTLEKEAGSWEILLASPLRSAQIIAAKLLGALRRSLPAWVPLMAHLLAFSWMLPAESSDHAYIAAPGGWLIMAVAAGSALFVAGAGVLLSVLFRKTSAAVAGSVALGIAAWVVMPILLLLASPPKHFADDRDPYLMIVSGNPVVQNIVLLERLAENYMHRYSKYYDPPPRVSDRTFHWPDDSSVTFAETAERVVLWALLHAGAGVLAALLAAGLCRRRV